MPINKLHIYRGVVGVYIAGLLVWAAWSKQLLRLFLLYAIVCILMWVFQRSFIYHSFRDVSSPSSFGLTGTSVERLVGADGVAIEAWVKPAAPGFGSIIVFHGNAGSLEQRVPLLRGLSSLGYGFVAIDYRGFGNSDGRPSEEGFYIDGRATMNYALNELGLKPEKITIMGESIGTGVAVQMALEFPVAGIFLQSPYTSLPDVAAGPFFWLPVHLLMSDRFQSIDKIGRVNMPVFVLHGEQDSTIPVEHGHRMYAAAREPKESAFLTNVGHNDFDVRDVVTFVDAFATKFGMRPDLASGSAAFSR